MYVGVDIGGTKTLLAALDDRGKISEKVKFPTPKDYAEFLLELKDQASQLTHKSFQAGGVACRGIIDRQHGRHGGDGILRWSGAPLVADTERIFDCPIALENDAKLAALSEALLLKKYDRVVYITVSTGIGFALVVNGVIDTNIRDLAGQALLLEHHGKLTAWEDFAGGKAIVQRYHKMGKDINDQATWQKIARDLSLGILEIIAMTEPEVIVFGGSVGVYFEKFEKPLMAELKKHEIPLIKLPELLEAQRPEEAVIYGCYDLARQVYGAN